MTAQSTTKYPSDPSTDKLERVVQIRSDHFTAGVVIHKGKVVDAAPIVKYMIGWDLERMLDYVKQKGWTLT